jgi:hypothetical protein
MHKIEIHSGQQHIFSFLCMFCRSLFVLLYFFWLTLCCLFFDSRIRITPLVSPYSSFNSNEYSSSTLLIMRESHVHVVFHDQLTMSNLLVWTWWFLWILGRVMLNQFCGQRRPHSTTWFIIWYTWVCLFVFIIIKEDWLWWSLLASTQVRLSYPFLHERTISCFLNPWN